MLKKTIEARKFCDFRRLKNKKLNLANSVRTSVPTLSECREYCLEEIQCRIFEFDGETNECRLSHFTEMSTLFVDDAFVRTKEDSVKMFEVATCYNGKYCA